MQDAPLSSIGSSPFGKIIFLNGASSSGKSTIAKHLHALLPSPFLYLCFDQLRDCGVLPMSRFQSGEFSWKDSRLNVFAGFHMSIAAYASAGCNVLVEHIIETENFRADLEETLSQFDLFLVAVECPLEELNRRERERGDRPIGDAARDLEVCYGFCDHDFRVDSTMSATQCAEQIMRAWSCRNETSRSRFRKIEL